MFYVRCRSILHYALLFLVQFCIVLDSRCCVLDRWYLLVEMFYWCFLILCSLCRSISRYFLLFLRLRLELTSIWSGISVEMSLLLDSLEPWSGCVSLLHMNNNVGFIHHLNLFFDNVFSSNLVSFVNSNVFFDAAKRLFLLYLSALLKGASVGPMIMLVIDFDSRWFLCSCL